MNNREGSRPPESLDAEAAEAAAAQNTATRAVRSGEHQVPPHSPAVTPVYQTAPFMFDSAEALVAGFERPDQRGLYSRLANPTVRVVEEKLAALEGAEDAVAFASGMAAISGTLGTLLEAGDRLLTAADLYGGTAAWLAWLVERHPSIELESIALDDLAERLERGVDERTRGVYLETPTNPLLRCCDLARVAAACQRLGVVLIVDNTFATPVLQRPLTLGATYVVHSATKYLGGHSDLTAGIVAGPATAMAEIRRTQRLGGACLDPHAAFLLARGMRTVALRVERQSENAARLVGLLRRHEAVVATYYPDDAMARRQMSAGGAMVAFEVRGGLPAANRLLDSLRLFTIMASLGGVESSVVLAAVTSHKNLTPAEREAQGIGDGLIRLSIGIEEGSDLEADLAQALSRVAG
ncbi:MAG: aminotransferase class I/II-fold pyridoxal phosphate-dependent enzyme [Acidobacteria bacterium]|nr:aminotransferase class I/II-fold pyridoxal phosphate-dependent enzyme [Acidobacteriota bacterium]